MADREILMITSCHRSGTSMLGGVLGHLGWQFPKTLIEASQWNQKGYFESHVIRELNDAMLREIDRPTFDFRDMPEGFDPDKLLSQFHGKIDEAMTDQFADSNRVLLKDPRLNRLLPVWQQYAKSTDQTLRVLMPLRHPAEVAASLNKRNGFSILEGQVIWLRETLMALHHTRHLPVASLSFSGLLTDWRQTLEGSLSQLGLELPPIGPETAAKIEDFISADLHHCVHNPEEPVAEDWVSNLADALHEGCTVGHFECMPDTITPLLNAALDVLGDVHAPGPEASAALESLQPLMTRLMPHETSAFAVGRPSFDPEPTSPAGMREQIVALEDENRRLQATLQEVYTQLRDRSGELAQLLSEETDGRKRVRHQILRVPPIAAPAEQFIIVLSELPTQSRRLGSVLGQFPEIFMLGETFHPRGSAFSFLTSLGSQRDDFLNGDIEDDFAQFQRFEQRQRAERKPGARIGGCFLSAYQLAQLPDRFCDTLLTNSRIIHYTTDNVLNVYIREHLRRADLPAHEDGTPSFALPCNGLVNRLNRRHEGLTAAAHEIQDHPSMTLLDSTFCGDFDSVLDDVCAFLNLNRPDTKLKVTEDTHALQAIDDLISNADEVRAVLRDTAFSDLVQQQKFD